MAAPTRQLNLIDRLISTTDNALRTLGGVHRAARPSPATSLAEQPLTTREARHAAGLMRVNHTGEVCAQALYQGQALTAKLAAVRGDMEQAALEEVDHLAWCDERLRELHETPSKLNPVWYGLSFGLGAAAGLVSDKISLGFVAATEDQVCAHLQDHLQRLPQADQKSRAIVQAMLTDEHRHGEAALRAGGKRFARPVKLAMRQLARVMTWASYRI